MQHFSENSKTAPEYPQGMQASCDRSTYGHDQPRNTVRRKDGSFDG